MTFPPLWEGRVGSRIAWFVTSAWPRSSPSSSLGRTAYRLLTGCVSQDSHCGRNRDTTDVVPGAEAWPPPPGGAVHQARPCGRAPTVHVYARRPQIRRPVGWTPDWRAPEARVCMRAHIS